MRCAVLILVLICWPLRLRAQDATPLPAGPRLTVGPGVVVFDAHDFENPHGARCVLDADHPCAPQKLLRALQDVLRIADDAIQTEFVARTPWPGQLRDHADSLEAREQVLAAARKIAQDCAAVEGQAPVTPQTLRSHLSWGRARPIIVMEKPPQILTLRIPGPDDADLVYAHGITGAAVMLMHITAPTGTAGEGKRLVLEIQSTGVEPIPVRWDAQYHSAMGEALPIMTHGTQAHPVYDQWVVVYQAQRWVLVSASTSDTSLVRRTERTPE